MFGSSLTRNLKGLDFFRSVPSEFAEGTVSGACISLVSISTLVFLTIAATMQYFNATIFTDLVIDYKHSQDKLQVNIDIDFPYVPCSLLSLDVENVLRIHLVNIGGSINKYNLPDMTPFSDKGLSVDQMRKLLHEQLNVRSGCKMVGFFEVERVPGNFHFSTHGYTMYVNQIFSQGVRKFDFSHRIHQLYFGKTEPQTEVQQSLRGYVSEKEIPDEFLGISYAYFLEVVQKNIIYTNGYLRESFFYTARINQLLIPNIPIVMFKFQTNPMTELSIGEYQSFLTFLIQIVAIIGGIFTVSSIVDQLVHSSIRYLVQKNRMGKLA